MKNLGAYEETAYHAIQAWKVPSETGALKKLARQGGLRDAPHRELLTKVVKMIVSLLNDLSQWTVRPEAAFRDYRQHAAGSPSGRRDHRLPGIAIEGGAYRAMGIAGRVPDVLTLITLNLRAVGELATYWGYDVTRQAERLYVLELLNIASNASDTTRAAMPAHTKRVPDLPRACTWSSPALHG